MKPILEELIGERVQIISIEAHKDEGTLIAFDEQWVVIERNTFAGSNRERLYFPIANIRLLKPV